MVPDHLIVPVVGRRAIFVYYKIAGSQVRQLKSAFANAGAAPFAAEVQLLRRAEASGATDAATDDLQTWMEIYWLPQGASDPADNWDVARDRGKIEAWALAAGLVGCICGPRHYEAFEACA